MFSDSYQLKIHIRIHQPINRMDMASRISFGRLLQIKLNYILPLPLRHFFIGEHFKPDVLVFLQHFVGGPNIYNDSLEQMPPL